MTTPYFRMYTVPASLSPNLIDPSDEQIRKWLLSPPETREGGWTLWGAQRIEVTPEGLEAVGYGDRKLILLDNGALEFWIRCLDETFQWRQSESERKLHPWIYPYALCEMPVNFFRLAKLVYDHANLEGEVLAGLAFYGIKGFILRPYEPGISGFEIPRPDRVRPYEREDLETRPVRASSADFSPDHVAYDLIQQVYRQFGYAAEHIPCFDAERNFTMKK